MKKFMLLAALVGGLTFVASTSTAEAGVGYGLNSGYGVGYRSGNMAYRTMPYRSGTSFNWNNNFRLNTLRPVYPNYINPGFCHGDHCHVPVAPVYVPSCGGYGW